MQLVRGFGLGGTATLGGVAGSVAALALAFSLAGCGSSDGSPGGAAGSEATSGGTSSQVGGTSNGGTSSQVGGTTSGGAPSGGSGAALTGTGSPPPAKGVGTACAADTDCASPLSCHFDTTDYTADMQCALACDSDTTCTAALGKDSFCIGANICVHACTTDADCSAKTHCNDAGWCERTGPGSGVPYCAGAATPCEALSDLACIGASGCVDNAKCTGVSQTCFGQFDEFSCSALLGCYWDSLGNDCAGVTESCDEHFASLSCSGQPGCTWTGGCTGVPDTCAKQFPSLCTDQPGCTLQTD